MQATVPQEERHDVTTLYHRMDLVELQDRFGLKVRPRHQPGSSMGSAPTHLDTHPPLPRPQSYSDIKGTVGLASRQIMPLNEHSENILGGHPLLPCHRPPL